MIAYLLIVCAAFYVVAASLIRLVGEYLFTQKVREEQRITQELADDMAPAFLNLDAEKLFLDAVKAGEENAGRILILDNFGVVQADSYSEYNGMQFRRSEVASVLGGAQSDYNYYQVGGDAGSSLLGGGTLSHQMMMGVYTAAIMSGNQRVGVLVYIAMAQDMFDSLMGIQRQILIWLVLVAVAVALLSLLMSRMITRPVAELNEGIMVMSRGDFSARVKVRGNSEFSRLAEAFNMMCERLESLDKSRNEFVSNASHELKTPLSTMKILLETLLYQDEADMEMQKEFLNDINKEIDRLSRIISDLLTLVHMDGGETQLKTEVISLSDLISDTIKRLGPLARERGIELEGTIREDVACMLDANKFQQVVYNLVDNAIKYTGRGGQVKVELSKAGKKAILKVSDTGMGIPKEDLIHIFDRFYRVDKARSRETGGTGLGLSIVKQIVTMHGGSISVVSEEEKGSTFTVELPVA